METAVKIKLSPITNLSDARFAAAEGIAYMGFCFDPSSVDFLLPIKAKEIIDWTTGSLTVGEFGEQGLEEISELSELLQLEVVLIKNAIPAKDLSQIGKPIIKSLDIDNMEAVELANTLCAYAPYADAFQLNGSLAIAARADELKEICLQYKIIWNLPFNLSSMPEVIAQFNPYAICLLAGSEEKTGMKEYEELYALLDVIAAK